MPLASLFALEFYGTGCVAAVNESVNTSPLADLRGEGRIGCVNTIAPTAYARISDGRRMAAVNTSVNISPLNGLRGEGRIAAVGKVNELSQDDVTGAVLEAEVEDGLSLKQALRLLLAVSQGDATGLDGNPIFKSVDGSKTRVAGTVSGGNRTITTRDAT